MFKFIMKQDSTFDMQEEEYALSKDIDVALWIDYCTFYGKCPLKELLGGNLIIVNEHFQDEFEEFRGKIQCAIGTTHILVKGIELPKLWLKSINAYLKSVAVLGSTYFLISSSDLDDICQWVTVTQKLYRAKIVLGGTIFATKIVPPGTILVAKSVPALPKVYRVVLEKGPLAIKDVGLSVLLCLICVIHSLLK